MYRIVLAVVYAASVAYCYLSLCNYMDDIMLKLSRRHPISGFSAQEWSEPSILLRLLLASSVFPINIALGYFFRHLPDGFMERVMRDVERKHGEEMNNKYIELRNCPFCGCRVISTDNHYIDGIHDAECFFYFVDHQREFDFEKRENFNRLVSAWNRRDG